MRCGVCCADGGNKEEVIQAQLRSRDYNEEHEPQLIPAEQFVQEAAFVEEVPQEELATQVAPQPEEKLEPPKTDDFPMPEPAPAEAKAPEQDNYFFEARIVKTPEHGLGVELSPHDGKSLLVGKVKEGAIADWNASRLGQALATGGDCKPLQAVADACDLVTCGDRIVAVNGKEGSAEVILGQIRADSILNMTIKRRLLINVLVRRTPGDELGVNLVEVAGNLIIKHISSNSAADKANRLHVPELELRSGDYIVQAGNCTELEEIKEQMRSGKDIEIQFRRASAKPHNV